MQSIKIRRPRTYLATQNGAEVALVKGPSYNKMLLSKMKHYTFKNVPVKRTKTMRAIRSKNTGIELKLRRALFERGLRYRLYSKKLPGKPDIVFRRHMIAVFCDSEFWHGRNWRSKKESIRSNRKYWIAKIENNMRRDRDVNIRLRKLGWTVLRFWEHEINDNLKGVIRRIEDSIKASVIQKQHE